MKPISKQQLKQKIEGIDDLTVINTLSPKQFEGTKIEGAINIPQDQNDFVGRVSAAVMDDKAAEIVVYCASQECDSSTKAAQKLIDAGFSNVYDYEGGAKDWNSSVQGSAN